MSDGVELARQQLQAARSQAIATVATIEAALASLPATPSEPEVKRLPYLGDEEEQ